MKLVVGLGNPGPKFESTRHNIGFMVVDRLARELGRQRIEWREDKGHKTLIAKTGDLLLAKPLTFTNNAGITVASLTKSYRLEPADVWVVHDDIDLPLGKIRIRQGGSSAGHHGVESIISHLHSSNFLRFRLGVGRGKENKGHTMDKKLHHRWVIDFVLSRFRQHEAGSLKHLVKQGAEAVRLALIAGIDKAMHRFN